MKRIISIIMLVTSVHAVDVVLGKLSELSWTGTDINKVATWGSTGGFETYSTLTEDRILMFNDYALTSNNPPTWIHEGPPFDPDASVGMKLLQVGTNHYHRTGWRLTACRTGSAYAFFGKRIVPPQVYTNYAANLQNTLGSRIESPVFSNGIGTVYFEAVNNDPSHPTRIRVSIATNMWDGVAVNPTNIVLNTETNGLTYIWHQLGEERDVNVASVTLPLRFIESLNFRTPIKLLIERCGSVAEGLQLDDALTVIDNIRVSLPPGAYRYQSPDYTGLGYEYPVETP